jgi:hypothetical protein
MNTSELHNRLRRILLDANPVGIYFEDAKNEDEYDQEIASLASGLEDCQTEAALETLLYEIFTTSFGVQSAGGRKKYADIAHEIWTALGR